MRALLAFSLLLATPAMAAAPEKPKPEPATEQQLAPKPVKPDYCANFADEARDLRFALQQKQLKDLEAALDKKIAELEDKRLEYLSWIATRDAELKKAEAGLVAIYAKMRPDAAAQQLTLLDRETAASILRQLKARNASAILNEMEETPAAQLSALLADPDKGAKK
jgi:flagellar motility protein MotE (MotC chaperone)